jgi:hypothetical protein
LGDTSRIACAIYTLNILPAAFTGFCVCHSCSTTEAGQRTWSFRRYVSFLRREDRNCTVQPGSMSTSVRLTSSCPAVCPSSASLAIPGKVLLYSPLGISMSTHLCRTRPSHSSAPFRNPSCSISLRSQSPTLHCSQVCSGHRCSNLRVCIAAADVADHFPPISLPRPALTCAGHDAVTLVE